MTSIANTKTQWQVQVRLSRRHKWRAKGTFETREHARQMAWVFRTGGHYETWFGLGFGNTRVVKKITGGL